MTQLLLQELETQLQRIIDLLQWKNCTNLADLPSVKKSYGSVKRESGVFC
jgi:hypothetical protein